MREISRDEQDVLARLGTRYRNFAEVERDLAELDGMRLEQRRREYLERELPPVIPATPPAEAPADGGPPPARAGGMWSALGLMTGIILVLGGAGFWLSAQSAPPVAVPAASAIAVVQAPASTTAASPVKAKAPIVQSRPTAAPAAQPAQPAQAAVVWTPAVCNWAMSTLQEDVQLDRAAAAAPPDPRYPGDTPGELRAAADRWQQVSYLIADDCAISTAVPDGAAVPDCSTAMAWLLEGAAGHDADLQRAGISADDRAWDQQWATFYRSLQADLARGGCSVG